MFASRVFRRCLIPAATLIEITESEIQKEECLCRPSELPIYTPERAYGQEIKEQDDELTGAIECTIRNARQTLTKYSEEIKAYKRVGLEHFERSRENVDCVIDYLREENNTLPKAGAISIGALTGLIFGLRGRIFKKTLYATTGALGMAAVCYPKEAAEYSSLGISEAKKYFVIAYNFVYGVKKDDPPLELPSLPRLPTSFSEAWGSVKSLASSFVSEEKDETKMGNLQTAQEQMPKLK